MLKSLERPPIKKNDEDYDYGFSTVSEEDIQPPVVKDTRAEELFKIIMPLLQNLIKDADKSDLIKWPNRKKIIQEQIDKINIIMAGL